MATDNSEAVGDLADMNDDADGEDEGLPAASIDVLLSGMPESSEKKSRVGGRVRAFRQVETAIAQALEAWSKRPDADTAVQALIELNDTVVALRSPKEKTKRTGTVTVKRPYYVGATANAMREAFRPELTKPDPREYAANNGEAFTRIYGPFNSREGALFRVDSGFQKDDPVVEMNR
jgi:hypothetical protein